jgi:BirA family transcriptional regulator, biotin operon repressor / biotin---[acetyl-CoA-carboxylase] ligase
LHELDKAYKRVNSGEFESLADEWEAQCATIGQEIMIRVGNRRIRGRAESLDSSGALLLRTHHGHLERIIGGDVTLDCLSSDTCTT